MQFVYRNTSDKLRKTTNIRKKERKKKVKAQIIICRWQFYLIDVDTAQIKEAISELYFNTKGVFTESYIAISM